MKARSFFSKIDKSTIRFVVMKINPLVFQNDFIVIIYFLVKLSFLFGLLRHNLRCKFVVEVLKSSTNFAVVFVGEVFSLAFGVEQRLQVQALVAGEVGHALLTLIVNEGENIEITQE